MYVSKTTKETLEIKFELHKTKELKLSDGSLYRSLSSLLNSQYRIC